ncbi:MAG: septum formation inhibitor [Alicyclobacillaceae bacterium]|nr:septum formation inhibitor [Alicyclobacillaceae bacterium]
MNAVPSDLAHATNRSQAVVTEGAGVRTPGQGTAPRPSARAARWNRVSAVLCIAFGTAVMWAVAGQAAAVERINDHIGQLRSEIAKTEAVNASLTAQVDQLTRPSRILGIAMGRLHMRYANPVQIPAGSSSGR